MPRDARLAHDLPTRLGYYTAGLRILILDDLDEDRVLVCLHGWHPLGTCVARVLPLAWVEDA